MLDRLHGLAGRDVIDVAAGTGRSALAVGRLARSVIGIEPDNEMRALAAKRQQALGTPNVSFRRGSTLDLSEAAGSTFDLVTCFHGPPFFESGDDERDRAALAEMLTSLSTVGRPGWTLALVVAAPGNWLPGVPDTGYDRERRMEAALRDAGFEWFDEEIFVDYGSREEALATYGFIYGPGAIDWLLECGASGYPWKNRVYLRRA